AYYLLVSEVFVSDLDGLRALANLKMAWQGGDVWVTGFTQEQVLSVTVASIPQKHLYVKKGEFLYILGKQLPDRKVPVGLLWTPIMRALKVETGEVAENYQADLPKLNIRLSPVNEGVALAEAILMRLPLTMLENYLKNESRVRYTHLTWCLYGGSEALVYGEPLLPLPSTSVYWQSKVSFIPLGYDYALQLMTDVVAAKLKTVDDLLLWVSVDQCITVSSHDFVPLSLSSFRKTMSKPITNS
ncbi:MAG: hypothetical protein AAFO69_21915, partial [Bacteroidota bacterium]